MRSDEDLKKIAIDIRAGQIFGTWEKSLAKNPQLLASVFMPLAFMDKEQWDAFVGQQPFHCFEYMEKAGPRSINGMPMFMSVQFLTEPEAVRIKEFVDKLVAAENSVV